MIKIDTETLVVSREALSHTSLSLYVDTNIQCHAHVCGS